MKVCVLHQNILLTKKMLTNALRAYGGEFGAALQKVRCRNAGGAQDHVKDRSVPRTLRPVGTGERGIYGLHYKQYITDAVQNGKDHLLGGLFYEMR